MKSPESIEKLIRNAEIHSNPDVNQAVIENLLKEFDVTEQEQKASVPPPNKRRIIMKSKITRFAAAAAIIIVGFVVINQFLGGTATFAQVIEPILNSRTVVYDLIVGEDETGLVIHDITKDSKIHRTMSNMPNNIMIIDPDSAKMLTLDTQTKGAAYVEIEGALQEGTRSYLVLVREIVTKLKDHPEWQVTELGEQEIDGQKVIGFRLSGGDQQLMVWADARMAVPIRIELRRRQSVIAIFKNIEFDVPVDDSLVSMDVPTGYTLHKDELNLSDCNEKDFIETLRMWAELLHDGKFPDLLSAENFMAQVPLAVAKIDQLDISDEQKLQRGTQFGRGITFFQFRRHQNEYYYAGKNVTLGDAEKAIFWYLPERSRNWRVIYGDLSVKDVAPENLPKLDDEKHTQMKPVEVTHTFFQACADEDWQEVLTFCSNSRVPQWLKDKYGGLKIISIGEPFKTNDYHGWYVPYEVRLKSDRIKKWNLALRIDYRKNRLLFDGGL
jgi:outer membrane lipoprotein-sorting protein